MFSALLYISVWPWSSFTADKIMCCKATHSTDSMLYKIRHCFSLCIVNYTTWKKISNRCICQWDLYFVSYQLLVLWQTVSVNTDNVSHQLLSLDMILSHFIPPQLIIHFNTIIPSYLLQMSYINCTHSTCQQFQVCCHSHECWHCIWIDLIW
jgi:hypothetical protein